MTDLRNLTPALRVLWVRFFCAAIGGVPCRYDVEYGFRNDETLAQLAVAEAAAVVDRAVQCYVKRFGEKR